jgi:16S rRNA (uracil1498-N3)-methyltransferase
MRRVEVTPDKLPKAAGDTIVLGDAASHYLRDVLRLDVDSPVELFDGDGSGWVCRIASLEPVTVISERRVVGDKESPLRVTLLQCIPKGDRWDWVLEKATELGVSEVVPVVSTRTVVRIPPNKVERKLERWRRIVSGAARQSLRTVTPDVHMPVDLETSLSNRGEDLLLYGHPGEAEEPAGSPSSVAIWIGPEGGFEDSELDMLRHAGARPLGLGPRVLRSETAGMFACGLVQARWGDLT